MRVLFMVFHFPPISGGGSVVPSSIANTLAELGHEVTVLTPDLKWTGKRYEPTINPGVKIIRVKTLGRSNLKLAARLCKFNLKRVGISLGKEKKFDFIFTIFHPFHLVPNAAVSCGKKLGIPIITKVDDAVYEKSFVLKSIQRKIEKILNAKSLHNSTKILVSNDGTRNVVNNIYKIPKEKISVIPNGIDVSFFETKDVDKKQQVVFVGAMYYHRGLDILLEAATGIVKILPDTKFILFGEGPEMSRLQNEVIKKNLSKNVEFKGWIPRIEIPEYLSESLIGVGPLRSTDVTKNALPIKILEYMASSLPIIVAEGTLQKEVLVDGHNGYFIKNSEDLAQKIIFLLKDDKLREMMGKRSKEMVEGFDWKKVVSLILNEYQRL
ncbi:MAG: glycosyltransferase family 4 protein, partial [Nitrosarchaeum sp.]